MFLKWPLFSLLTTKYFINFITHLTPYPNHLSYSKKAKKSTSDVQKDINPRFNPFPLSALDSTYHFVLHTEKVIYWRPIWIWRYHNRTKSLTFSHKFVIDCRCTYRDYVRDVLIKHASLQIKILNTSIAVLNFMQLNQNDKDDYL